MWLQKLFILHSFFFKKLISFNWRIIALQYCDGFCHIATWIGCRYIYIPPSWTLLPPPSAPYPSGLSQSTGFGCSASCIELVLVICFTYDNLHISMLFSQLSHPYLLPLSQKFCLLSWDSLKKLGIELLYGPTIPLLDIHPKTRIERGTCTPTFIAALFTIVDISKTYTKLRILLNSLLLQFGNVILIILLVSA